MKKNVLLALFVLICFNLFGTIPNSSPANLFQYDENKIKTELNDLFELEQYINHTNSTLNELKNSSGYMNLFKTNQMMKIQNMRAPWNIPSFWFAFTISTIGTFFIITAWAGPVAVAIVYLTTGGDKVETKKAGWGCLAGMILGGGSKYLWMKIKS